MVVIEVNGVEKYENIHHIATYLWMLVHVRVTV